MGLASVVCARQVAFFIALVFIGLVTAVIGDFAALFGCVIGAATPFPSLPRVAPPPRGAPCLSAAYIYRLIKNEFDTVKNNENQNFKLIVSRH